MSTDTSTATLTAPLTSLGHELPTDPESFGWLRESTDATDDPAELRQRFADDGYLFIRDFFDAALVLDARRSVFKKLAVGGQLDPDRPVMDGVLHPSTRDDSAGGGGRRSFRPDLAAADAAVERVVYGPELLGFYERFFAEPIRHFDFTWLRVIPTGQGTPCHCDWVYMGRGSRRLMTCWVPYVDVPLEVGGLMLLEGSFRQEKKLKGYLERDVDTYCENRPGDVQRVKDNGGQSFPGYLSQRPDLLPKQFDGRWLTAEAFRPGDFITFRMDMVHGSLDNHTDRVRMSTDTRYQPASEPADERWVGPNPPGHGKAGKRGRIC